MPKPMPVVTDNIILPDFILENISLIAGMIVGAVIGQILVHYYFKREKSKKSPDE